MVAGWQSLCLTASLWVVSLCVSLRRTAPDTAAPLAVAELPLPFPAAASPPAGWVPFTVPPPAPSVEPLCSSPPTVSPLNAAEVFLGATAHTPSRQPHRLNGIAGAGLVPAPATAAPGPVHSVPIPPGRRQPRTVPGTAACQGEACPHWQRWKRLRTKKVRAHLSRDGGHWVEAESHRSRYLQHPRIFLEEGGEECSGGGSVCWVYTFSS